MQRWRSSPVNQVCDLEQLSPFICLSLTFLIYKMECCLSQWAVEIMMFPSVGKSVWDSPETID